MSVSVNYNTLIIGDRKKLASLFINKLTLQPNPLLGYIQTKYILADVLTGDVTINFDDRLNSTFMPLTPTYREFGDVGVMILQYDFLSLYFHANSEESIAKYLHECYPDYKIVTTEFNIDSLKYYVYDYDPQSNFSQQYLYCSKVENDDYEKFENERIKFTEEYLSKLIGTDVKRSDLFDNSNTLYHSISVDDLS